LKAVCIVALIFIPSSTQAAGKSRSLGSGAHSSHPGKIGGVLKAAKPRHVGFRQYPIFGVPYVGGYDDGPVPSMLAGFELSPQPPRALTCQRTQQTVVVPSESGGTREITVTRCGAL
jgi:hypothetical protein